MGWTCNTLGKMRSVLAAGTEMPPNINIAVKYKTGLRKTGYVALRVKGMSSRVQGRMLMLTVFSLRFLTSTSL